MKESSYMKTCITGILAFLSSVLGTLSIPVVLMVICNIVDYITGLMASRYRRETINSYKSIKGIFKKVCMWMLVIIGAIIDRLIIYTSDTIGVSVPISYFVACLVAIWIVCSEIISILENIQDIGVEIPPFLIPLMRNIKGKVEDQ